uniref:Uncharacterized protein n=1 Tax=Tetranychus urticae TaxID=32264 RepID=T1JQZ7_TETUR
MRLIFSKVLRYSGKRFLMLQEKQNIKQVITFQHHSRL